MFGIYREARWNCIALPWLMIVGAWCTLFVASVTQQGALLDHDYLLRVSQFPWMLALVVFLASWQIMLAAMMLPALLSPLSTFALVSTSSRSLWARQLLFLLGYALVWTVFALLAFLGDTLLHWLIARWWWLYLYQESIAVTLLLLAGAFQLSPFKRIALDHCTHLPASYQAQRWGTWLFGLRYALSCLGSCWAIMLVMFALGMKQLIWLALLALLIWLEREKPAWRLRILSGIVFLAAGVGVWVL